MQLDAKFLLKFVSPRIVAKALTTMDKSTAVVVGVSWIAVVVMLFVAVYAVHGAVEAKKQADAALVAEPVLPTAQTSPLSESETNMVLDRLKRQFPDLVFEFGPNQSIVIKTSDGSRFHQWITALGYIDSMAPQFHWALNDFCVGKCISNDLMHATIVGEKMVYTLPQKK